MDSRKGATKPEDTTATGITGSCSDSHSGQGIGVEKGTSRGPPLKGYTGITQSGERSLGAAGDKGKETINATSGSSSTVGSAEKISKDAPSSGASQGPPLKGYTGHAYGDARSSGAASGGQGLGDLNK
jgi:hypothetical protein